MHVLDDTIAAIASPPGGAARGILRISGPRALECLARLFLPDDGQSLSGRRFPMAVAGRLRLDELHSPIACDAYLWSNVDPSVRANVRSYTGQPVVELHTLGSPPLLQRLLCSICAAGARLADPGEFTLRAFLAGRIDLTQAEAVLGVIDAAGPDDLGVALGQLAGGLARPLHRLRDDLLDLLAHLEAGFDFADEDVAFITCEELQRRLVETEQRVEAVLRQMASRGEAAETPAVVLVGRPNTGKSSLFNALIGNRAALVSDRSGTTRDYLTAELDFDGVRCRLIDTAGARYEPLAALLNDSDSSEEIEHAAQSATDRQRRGAHLQVFCLDSTRPLDHWEIEELQRDLGRRRIVVLTKCDAPRTTDGICATVETSSLTARGIDLLRSELRRSVLACAAPHGDVVGATAARCQESLRLAGECLRRAVQVASDGREELAAAEIRTALEELGKVVGAVYTEDVLDRIFSRFCVGK